MKSNWQWKFAILLTTLIVIPSILLAYFSVKAIESERLVYEQRIKESYQRLIEFAASEINDLFKDLNEKWVESLQPTQLVTEEITQQRERLKKFINDNPMVDAAYLVSNTGKMIYPPAIERGVASNAPEADNISEVDKWLQKFRRLSDDAERLEFTEKHPKKALEIFRNIANTFPVPRLRAIALSEIARIYMFNSEWKEAYQAYQQLIQKYPRARDLNNLHLRFYAKYQCVRALDNLNRLDESMLALLNLYQDLLEHSDEVNRVQYEFFLERIHSTFQKLINIYKPEQKKIYSQKYAHLQEQKKKNIGTTYLVEKLYQRLNRNILKRNTYRSRFKYFSDFNVEQPYLVAYILLAENEKFIVKSALGLIINLEALKGQLFPQITEHGDFPKDVTIAIFDNEQNFILGDKASIVSEPVAKQSLRDPLDFWELEIFPTLENPLLSGSNRWLYAKLWGIFLLWLVIIFGAGVALYSLLKQRRLSLQKTTFISSITHELKTPLTSIKMFSDILSKNANLKKDTEAQKYLDIIKTESNRLAQLVDNVLDFAKIERGVKQYHFEYEEPEAVIRSVVDTFQYQANIHGVPIELNLESPMPEVFVDRNAVSQALINLISNAIKYSPNKQKITIEAAKNGQFVNISVVDHGLGIEKKYLNRIFDDYFRINEKSSENIAGTGLGLPLVKRIAEAHGGSVAVESEYGKGSTFTLKLPLAKN